LRANRVGQQGWFMKTTVLWSAVAERSGDTALGGNVCEPIATNDRPRAGLHDTCKTTHPRPCKDKSGVAASLCHRTPKAFMNQPWRINDPIFFINDALSGRSP